LKKLKSLGVIISLLLISTMLLSVVTVSAATDTLLDSFDIGDTTSEVGHNLEGWSDPWDWGGGYGGGDDGTLRLLMGPGDGCTGHEDAYFTMDAGGGCATSIKLRHLDGSQPDDFDLYIVEDEIPVFIGSYAQQSTIEEWFTTEFNFAPRTGEIKFKLVATSPIYSWCTGWGQVAFSWAELYGDSTPVATINFYTEAGLDKVSVFGEIDNADVTHLSFNPTPGSGNYGGRRVESVTTAAFGDTEDAGYVNICGLSTKVRCLIIEVLDGLADDSFNVYILNPGGNWVLVYEYDDEYTAETWVSHVISGFPAAKGQKKCLDVKIELTGDHWSGFDTYGQLAIDWIKLFEL
jgi:hypothetical protein